MTTSPGRAWSEPGARPPTVMKRGGLVCVAALGGVAVGLALWALRRWQDDPRGPDLARVGDRGPLSP